MEYAVMAEQDVPAIAKAYMEYYNLHENGCWQYKKAYKRIHQRERDLCCISEQRLWNGAAAGDRAVRKRTRCRTYRACFRQRCASYAVLFVLRHVCCIKPESHGKAFFSMTEGGRQFSPGDAQVLTLQAARRNGEFHAILSAF